MTLNLLKLAVGAESLADLTSWVKEKAKAARAKGKKPEIIHLTRQTPKREDDVLDGGSLYWVIKGVIAARMPIIALRPSVKQGVPACAIVMAPKVIAVAGRPHRPFQGWRYLAAKDAPPDLKGSDRKIPEALRAELASLGLL